MLKKLKNRKSLFLAAAVLVLTLAFGVTFISSKRSSSPSKETQNQVEMSKEAPRLKIFTSPVSVMLPGQDWQEAVDNQEITAGTKVKTETAGRAQIIYPNKSVTRLDEKTEITVEN